jgi:hypothetical protein
MDAHELGSQAVPFGLVPTDIARMFHWWGDTPQPTAAQLTTLRHLQSDLSPLLGRLDGIPDQTDDPALLQAAERAHEAMSALLAEMAVVIQRAKRHPRNEVPNSAPAQPRASRQANAPAIAGTKHM